MTDSWLLADTQTHILQRERERERERERGQVHAGLRETEALATSIIFSRILFKYFKRTCSTLLSKQGDCLSHD